MWKIRSSDDFEMSNVYGGTMEMNAQVYSATKKTRQIEPMTVLRINARNVMN